MDIREFIQVLAGAIVLKPDELLLQSAAPSSYFLAALTRAVGPRIDVFGAFSVLHTFALVVGIGLLMGIGASTSLFIGIFVVLGVAEGLFAVGAFFGVLGLNSTAMTDGIASALGPTFSHAVVADGYALFPFAILLVGVVRYRWGEGKHAMRAAVASHDSQRHYCSFCGSVIGPGLGRCTVCKKGVSKKAEGYCSSCGRPVPKDAKYCWFCGDEVLWSGAGVCRSCAEFVATGAKFCPHCGARQQAASAPPSGSPQTA